MKELIDMEYKELLQLSIDSLNMAIDQFDLLDEEKYRIVIAKEILNKALERK